MFKILLLSTVLATANVQEQDDQDKNEQTAESQPEEPLTYQENVVVTATGYEEKLIDSIALVTPIDAEDLSRSPALVIDDTLRRVPGFSLFRRSSSLFSHPTTQGVSLRGIGPSGASRSLVLWNGLPLNDPFGNWVYWNRLPATSIEQAEVARGATSQLYGSSALAGTIQLVPRAALNSTFDARLQFGNRGTYDADIFASDQAGDLSWIASGRVFDTDGYIPVREEDRGDVDVPAKTKFQTFLGRVEYRDFHVGVNLYDEERSNGTPAQVNDSHIYLVDTGYDTDRWSFNFYGQKQQLASSFSRILPGRDREIPFGETIFPSVGFGSSFSMRTDRGIQWGIDWRYVNWDPDEETAGDERTQNFFGAFLQYELTFKEQFELLLGGRFDLWQNAATKGTFNPRLGLTYRAFENATVRASVYRGFRAPSLNELYRPFRVGNILTAPNDGLNEEYLWGVEGGVDLYPSRDVLVRLNAFYNSFQDPIANVTLCTEPTDLPLCVDLSPGSIQRQRQNLGSATIAGFEAAVSYLIFENWSLRGSYLFSNAINDDTDRRLPQVAKNQGNIGLGYDGPFQFTIHVRVVGDAFEDDLNEIVLPNFGVLDLSLRVPVTPKLNIYLAIENAFDQEYAVRADPLEILGTPRMVHGGIELRLLN